MSDKQETVADIISEMCSGSIPQHRHDRVLLRHYAERIEAAYRVEKLRWVEANAGLAKLVDLEKIPTGNTAKMLEAIKVALDYFDNLGTPSYEALSVLNILIDAYKKWKPRNCDIGTADEQAKRFHNVCKKYKLPNDACEASCPMQMSLDCELAWSQMEYEEEGK